MTRTGDQLPVRDSAEAGAAEPARSRRVRARTVVALLVVFLLVAGGVGWGYRAYRAGLADRLEFAAIVADANKVKSLLKQGADPKAVGGSSVAPLWWASYSGKIEFMAELVAHGADLECEVGGLGTPLCAAASRGNVDAVQWLLSKGARIDVVQEPGGWTPLHALMIGGRSSLQSSGPPDDVLRHHPRTAVLLLDAGCPANAQAALGQTALHLLAQCGPFEALLIERGSRPDEKLPSALAEHHQRSGTSEPRVRDELAGILLNHGADPNLADRNGQTPLHDAAWCGDAGFVEFLLGHGAKADLQTMQNQTALDLARIRGHEAVIKLLEAGRD